MYQLLESDAFKFRQAFSFFDVSIELLRNPEIDEKLSELLHRFLLNVDKLSNETNKVNFVEAALLLENSTNIYCKKVDMLWDVMLDFQKRLLSTTKSDLCLSQETKKLEKKCKRKKLKTFASEIDMKFFEKNVTFGLPIRIDLTNELSSSEVLFNHWQKFNETIPRCLTLNDREFVSINRQFRFTPLDFVYSQENDCMFRINQLHSITCIWVSLSHLENSLILSNSNIKQFNVIRKQSSTSFSADNCIQDSFVRLVSLPNDLVINKLKKRSISNCSEQFITESKLEKRSFVLLERLTDDVIYSKLRRLSVNKKVNNQDILQLSANDSYKINNQGFSYFDCVETNCKFIKSFKSNMQTKHKSLTKSVIDLSKKIRKINKNKHIAINRIEKLLKGITVNSSQMEMFFNKHYIPGVGEELKNSYEINSTNYEDNEFFDHPSESGILSEFQPSSIQESQLSNSKLLEEVEMSTSFELPLKKCETINPRKKLEITDSLISNQTYAHRELLLQEESRQNLSKWRKHIIPKLRESTESTFNIHEYGVLILHSANLEQEAFFKQIMHNKSCAEITRFFIAILQLANSGNIVILGNKPGQISNNSFKIRVIKKKQKK